MDTEDGDCDGGLSGSQEEKSEKVAAPPVEDYAPDGMQLISPWFSNAFPANDYL